jgi:DNA polymerase-3 subunit chi
MAEIGFYHLTRMDVAAALPALLGRSLAAGERALVLCGDAARVAALDAALWLPDWLPHGTAATPHPEWQPVFLSAVEENPAGARFLFLVDGAESADIGAYKRVFDLFDGNDEAAVVAARARWAAAKAAGHVMTYWRQGEAGWEKASASAGGT